MSMGEIDALRARLVELELAVSEGARLRRRNRWVAVGVALVTGLAAIQGAVIAQGTVGQTVRGPFRVVDARGNTILLVDGNSDGTTVDLIANDKVAARLQAGSESGLLSLSNSGGFARLAMNANGPDSGPTLQLRQGNVDVLAAGPKGLSAVKSMEVTTADGRIAASLRGNDADGAVLTVGNGTNGSFMAGTGKSGNGFAFLTSKSGGYPVQIGMPDGRPWGIYIADPARNTVQASLGLDGMQQGIVRVGPPNAARGVLGLLPGGGGSSLALYDGPGNKYRVGMYAVPNTGFLSVDAGNGEVNLEAAQNGASVHVANKGGIAAVALALDTDGSGLFSISDAAGETMVDAGVSDGGVGRVRTGPAMRKLIGMGATVQSALLGKKN